MNALRCDMVRAETFLRSVRTLTTELDIELHFVFDGVRSAAKVAESFRRKLDHIEDIHRFFHNPSALADVIPSIYPISFFRSFVYMVKDAGFVVERAYEEADCVIVRRCIDMGAWGVVSNDSDMFLTDVPREIQSDTFVLAFKNYSSTRTLPIRLLERDKIRSILGIEPDRFPLLACCIGNDFSKETVLHLHHFLGIRGNCPMVVSTIVSYFRHTKKPLQDILADIRSTLPPEHVATFNEAYRTTHMLLAGEIPSPPDFPDHARFFACDAFLDITLNTSAEIFRETLTNPAEPSAYPWCLAIRKRLYAQHRVVPVVEEHYISGATQISDTLRVIIPETPDSPLDIPLSFATCFLDSGEPWLYVLAHCLAVLAHHNQDIRHLLYLFYTAGISTIDPPPFYNARHDHRFILHAYHNFHCVLWHLNELLIDVLHHDRHYLDRIMRANLVVVCSGYDRLSAVDDAIASLVATDSTFGTLAGLVL